MIIQNLTNPNIDPVEGDKIVEMKNGFKITHTYVNPSTEEELAREWRNEQLQNCDWIVPLSDHPERETYMTYRAALRAWPSTSDFPTTKPVLG